MSRKLRFFILSFAAVTALGGCSRENREWRAAQATDTIEAYGRFLEQNPDGKHAPQAHARVEQLGEQRDWQRASAANTQAAYRQFVLEHPNSKWAQEARIRAENFALDDGAEAEVMEPMPAIAQTTPTNEVDESESTATATDPMERKPSDPTPTGDVLATRDVPPASDALPASDAPPATGVLATEPNEAAVVTPVPPVGPPKKATASPAVQLGFAIQLGAFGSEAKARDEWQRLAARFNPQLGGLRPEVHGATTAAGRLYRLQARLETEQQARNICAALRQGGQGCVVVLPSTR